MLLGGTVSWAPSGRRTCEIAQYRLTASPYWSHYPPTRRCSLIAAADAATRAYVAR